MGKCHDMPRSGGSRRAGMMKPDYVEAMLGLYERADAVSTRRWRDGTALPSIRRAEA